MKLKKFFVDNYKNLQSFQIDFTPGDGLSILVGNNGSGKSNVLEVISGIFHDLFQAKNKRSITCDYSLEYVLDDVNCKLVQKNGDLRCYAPKRIARNRFVSDHAPNNVIGLYSGEENRLWTSFYELYYKMYMRRIFAHEPPARMRLAFVNKYYWNVAFLTLLLSDNDTLKPFVEKDLGIKKVSTIELEFEFKHFHEANDLLKSFINKINPKHEKKHRYSLADLKERITRETHRDELGKEIVEHVDIDDLTKFRLLAQAYMPKDKKLIDGIVITVNGNVTVEQLSEGEKKLILVKTVLEILSDEKTLALMDEPDAHLHEGRKAALVDMMREYPNRQIVIATHSPVIAQLVRKEEMIMLENIDGRSALLSEEKRSIIHRLTGRAWDVIEQEMIFRSSKPLIVFEGKFDVKYVKKALQVFQHADLKYQKIKVDFISCGGADNAQVFVRDLFSVIPSDKRVYVFFDRDDAGKKGAAALLDISKDNEKIVKYSDICKDNLTVGFIPYREGVTSGDFLIEDYFLWDRTIKQMVTTAIEAHHHPLKQLPPLAKTIKEKLETNYESLSDMEFAGFKSIIEKLYVIASAGEHS